MNVVLEWVKSNVLIVVFSVVMIAALITLPLIASGMNDDVAQEVDRRARKLNELGQLERTQVSPPGRAGETQAALVNERFLQNFRNSVRLAQEDADQVYGAALAHNHKDRGIIRPQEPVFPTLPRGEEETVPWRFYESVGDAYRDLFQELRMGGPPELETMREDIESRERQFRTHTLSKEPDDPLTDEEARELREVLSSLRLMRYEQAAESVSLYATKEILQRPSWSDGQLPSISQMFEWQWRYWIQEDVLRALAMANASSPSVLEAPVKRIIWLGVGSSPAQASGSGTADDRGRGGMGGGGTGGGGGGGVGMSGGAPNPVTEAPVDFSVSLTGRRSNPLYDVRYVDLEIVVDSNRIPEVLDALAQYNFMTVIGLRKQPADPYAAAASGYFYGPSPVSLLTLQLETVWFREWTSEFMPDDVKQALGIPVESSGGSGETAADW